MHASSHRRLALLIDALRALAARETLAEATPEPRRRPPSLWRTLLARDSLPEATPPAKPAIRASLPSLLLAREALPPPPPRPTRSSGFWRWLTDRETLPEETEDVR